jgi:hypothetical protein
LFTNVKGLAADNLHSSIITAMGSILKYPDFPAIYKIFVSGYPANAPLFEGGALPDELEAQI